MTRTPRRRQAARRRELTGDNRRRPQRQRRRRGWSPLGARRHTSARCIKHHRRPFVRRRVIAMRGVHGALSRRRARVARAAPTRPGVRHSRTRCTPLAVMGVPCTAYGGNSAPFTPPTGRRRRPSRKCQLSLTCDSIFNCPPERSRRLAQAGGAAFIRLSGAYLFCFVVYMR